MNNILTFINKYFTLIVLALLLTILFRTCGSDSKSINKRIDELTIQIKSLKDTSITKNDLKLEGLKTEKRMIQSTDRKILDVNRQSQIDDEIKKLEK